MELELIKKDREASMAVPLPISEEELCRRYEGVFTAAVNDVLRGKGLICQTLPNSIRPLRDDMKVAGICFTLKGCKNMDLTDEMMQRAQMLEAIQPNSICVWDTSGDDESAQWGEIMTMAAKKRGCRGAVVDGGVRDTNRVLGEQFPVFCKYKTSNGMLGRFRMVGWQLPISIGRVLIRPGDVIFGDIDGVIVIPRELAMEVLEEAEAIRDGEVTIKQMVRDGVAPTDIVKNGGYF